MSSKLNSSWNFTKYSSEKMTRIGLQIFIKIHTLQTFVKRYNLYEMYLIYGIIYDYY